MNILNYTISELEEILTSNGFKKYNAAQICDWIYKKHVFAYMFCFSMFYKISQSNTIPASLQ